MTITVCDYCDYRIDSASYRIVEGKDCCEQCYQLATRLARPPAGRQVTRPDATALGTVGGRDEVSR